MKDYGLVSIITPSYNCADYIGETIESIQAQSYNNWELLITDDCSSDKSLEVIRSYADKDPRIKVFAMKENSGAAVARNNSIDNAKGKYIAFCDADDKWYPLKLEKQLKFMETKPCDMSYTSYMTTTEDGEINGIVVSKKHYTFSKMKRDDKIGCLTMMYNAEKLGKVYMPLLRKRQDWGMKLKVLQKCGVAYGLKEPLAYYRLRNDSISRDKRNLVKYNIAVYRKVFGWSYMHATLFFLTVFMPTYLVKRAIQYYINN